MNYMVDTLTLIESVIDNKMMELNYQFDRLMMEHKENIHSIECKILFENGTDDDLCTLYTAEAEEVKKKSKGILASIINAVKAFFNKLRKVLFGEPAKEEDVKSDIEVPENPDNVLKEGNSALTRIKNILKGNGAKIAVGALAAGGAFVIAKKKVIPYINDMKQFMQRSEETLNEASNSEAVEKLSSEQQEELRSAVNDAKKAGSKASGIVKKINSVLGINEDAREYHKQQNIVRSSQKTKAKIDASLEQNKSMNTKDEEEIKKLQQQVRIIENKSGVNGSFLSKLLNKQNRDAKKIASLKKRIDSGDYTDAELNQYTDLLKRHGETSAKYSTEINNAMNEIKKIQSRINSRNEKIAKLNDKRSRASEAQKNAAEQGAAILAKNQPVKESADALCEGVDTDIEDFITSIN